MDTLTGMSHAHKYFYDEPIFRSRQQAFVNDLLKKYKNEPATEELRQKIYDDLSAEKAKGTLKMPFKVILKQDALHRFPDQIEILLDTKV